MEIAELISLAEAAIGHDSKSEEFVQALESYSAAFDHWFSANQSKLSDITDQAWRSQVDRLVELHEGLVERVNQVQAEHPDDMKKLKQRGKGIMAYTDLLPKRLSMRRPTKG